LTFQKEIGKLQNQSVRYSNGLELNEELQNQSVRYSNGLELNEEKEEKQDKNFKPVGEILKWTGIK
jgi:hypothetical protein